ncbi:unnamed protein product [Heligmosomoides polygyrus]|uniref:Uncharacterized protein n=1 Tax=Heligmosomoides polygyrus TaxID=6339 RepID=A0A183FNN8_HELPZ|nr:unnamed protein product [Heligmosomoides polygyrus]
MVSESYIPEIGGGLSLLDRPHYAVQRSQGVSNLAWLDRHLICVLLRDYRPLDCPILKLSSIIAIVYIVIIALLLPAQYDVANGLTGGHSYHASSDGGCGLCLNSGGYATVDDASERLA